MENLLPVLLGSDQNAYGMARSFHMAYGVKSAIIARRLLPACANSSLISETVLEKDLENESVLVQTLQAFAEKHPEKTLILVPCSDAYARLCARRASDLRARYHFALSDEETLETLSQKEGFYKTCEALGLSYPKTFEFDPRTEHAPSDTRFPAVLKPADSAAYWNCSFEGKRKVFFLRDKAELDDVLSRLKQSDYPGKVLLQDFIPGDDSAMRVINAYFGKNGKLKLFCVGRVLLEEHTPEGIGSYAAILTEEDSMPLYDLVKPLLEHFSYHGFLNIDAKFDCRTNTYQFFELNPRQGRSSFFVSCAGANLARVITEDVLEQKQTTPVFAADPVLWTNVPKHVIQKYVKDPELKQEALRAYREKRVYNQMRYEKDFSLTQRKKYYLNQLHQIQKYRRYFLDKLALGGKNED